jgi:hypothetical protein
MVVGFKVTTGKAFTVTFEVVLEQPVAVIV